jgi:lipid-binding SYLF domain-containing protein
MARDINRALIFSSTEVIMTGIRILFAAATLSALTLAGCATDPPQTASDQQALRQDTQSALHKMYTRDAGLRDFVEGAHAYAIFPSVGKGGVIVGGASGRGEVFEQGRQVGYAELNQVTAGAQIGGQEYAELIVFQTPEALRKFQDKEYSFSANASAVVLKAGASKEAHFENGIAVFTLPTGGFMAEATLGGQSFNYQPLAGTESHLDRDTNSADNASYRRSSDTQYRNEDTYRRTDTTVRQENPDPTYHRTETKTEIRTENR